MAVEFRGSGRVLFCFCFLVFWCVIIQETNFGCIVYIFVCRDVRHSQVVEMIGGRAVDNVGC